MSSIMAKCCAFLSVGGIAGICTITFLYQYFILHLSSWLPIQMTAAIYNKTPFIVGKPSGDYANDTISSVRNGNPANESYGLVNNRGNARHPTENMEFYEFQKIIKLQEQLVIANSRVSLKSGNVTYKPPDVELRAQDKAYFNIFSELFPDAATINLTLTVDEVRSLLPMVVYDTVADNCDAFQAMGQKCTNTIPSEPVRYDPQPRKRKNAIIRQDTLLMTYIHVIPKALIERQTGNVIVNGVKIIPHHCANIDSPSQYQPDLPIYKEVFLTTQQWGNNYFHMTIESLPRIMPYLPFLLEHPDIMIHIGDNSKILPYLGIASSRILTGAVISEILYLPMGTICSADKPIKIWPVIVLAEALRRSSNRTYTPKGDVDMTHYRSDDVNIANIPSTFQDTVILIKRSKRRWLNNHDAIYEMLQYYCDQAGLRLVVFTDNPLPEVDETRDIFQRALIVIGPHGAGESNVIFSQPGVVIIECICLDPENPILGQGDGPHDTAGSFDYVHLARVLGMRYHGVVSPHNCLNITAAHVERPFISYLHIFGYNVTQNESRKS